MTNQSTEQRPWQQPQPSYGVKLLITLGAALLLIIALVTLFLVIGISGSFIRGSQDPETAPSNIIALGVSLVLLLVSGFGLIKLFPYLRAPANFKPSYGVIAPDVTGHLFEVRLRRIGWGRTLDGKGTARFEPEALVIEGWLTPSPLFQVAVILLLTIVPLVWLGFGLGLIPALIIAYYVGRKKLVLSTPYSEVRDLQMSGCIATFGIPTSPPGKVSFAAAQVDGERLYRELGQRIPV